MGAGYGTRAGVGYNPCAAASSWDLEETQASMSELSDRTARSCPDAVIVTGAGRGIGRAIAIDLGNAGARVLCLSRTANADRTAAEIREKGGRAEGLVLDLADYAGVERTVGHRVAALSLQRWGVVLAAGILGPAGPLAACQRSGQPWCPTWDPARDGELALWPCGVFCRRRCPWPSGMPAIGSTFWATLVSYVGPCPRW